MPFASVTFLPLLPPLLLFLFWAHDNGAGKSQPLRVLVSLSLKNWDAQGLLEVRHASLDILPSMNPASSKWWCLMVMPRKVKGSDCR